MSEPVWHRIGGLRISHLALATGVSGLALAMATPARAQQAAPGDPSCPRSGTDVTCTGTLANGIAIVTADNIASLTVRDLTAPVAPAAGLSGINFIRTNGPITVRVDPTARGINVNGGGNGIELYTYDADISLVNGAPITGRDVAATDDLYGIRTWLYDTDDVEDAVRHSISLTNTGAIDVQLTNGSQNTQDVYGISARIDGDGELTVRNTAPIRAAQGGSNVIAYGISLDMTGRNTVIDLINDGAITIDNPVNGTGIDIGLHGLLRPGTSNGRASIVNNGTITGRMRVGIDVSGVIVGGIKGFTTVDLTNNGVIDINTGTSSGGAAIQVLDDVSGDYRITNTAALRVAGGGYGMFISVGSGFRDYANYVPGTVIVRNGGAITTENGIGILAEGDRFDIVNTADISTRGSSNDAIQAGEYNQTLGQSGFRGNMANVSRLENSGNLAAAGNFSNGLVGYFVGAGSIVNRGTITTAGTDSYGMSVQLLTDATVDNSGAITVSGADSIGVDFQEYSVGPTSRIEDPNYNAARDLGSAIRFTTSADVRATGAGGIGISIDAGAFAFDSADAPYLVANYRGTSTVTVLSGVTVAGGGEDGIGIRYTGRGTNTLDNRGTITAASGRAVTGGDGAEIILNTGRIDGSVALGGGADIIRTLAGGVYNGTIDMGAGADLIEVSNATSITRAVTMGAGDDRITITPGIVFTADVDGGAGDDRLVLDIADGTRRRADFATGSFTNFETIEKLGAGTFLLDEGVFSRVLLQGGTLTSTGSFGTGVEAANGTVVLASGRLGPVSMAGGSILRPGSAAIGSLATGNLTLGTGATLEMNVSDSGQADRIDVTGSVSVGGATLRILDAGSLFAGGNPFTFTLIGNDGADAIAGTFASVVNQLAFLTPTLNYAGGDGNDLVLTLTPRNISGTPAAPGNGCLINGATVICSGRLPDGVDISPPDTYTHLRVERVEGAINAANPDGVAIDFTNTASPVSINVDARGTSITSRGASFPRPPFTVGSSVAVGIRAQTSGNIVIANNADIGIDTRTVDYGRVTLAAGIAADMIQSGTASRDFAITNSGNISVTAGGAAGSGLASGTAGIYAGYSGVAGISPNPPSPVRIGVGSITNSGAITVQRGAGILAEDLGFGRLDILNSGTINVTSIAADIFTRGIRVEDGGFNLAAEVRNTGDIFIEDTGSTVIGIELEKDSGATGSAAGVVVNDGRIVQRNRGEGDYGIGIDIESPSAVQIGQGRARTSEGATLTAINDGLIETSAEGITLSSNANRAVRNAGTIDVGGLGSYALGVQFNFNTPNGSNPTPYNPIGNITRFENASGAILRVRGAATRAVNDDVATALQIFGGDPVIVNDGLISATGFGSLGVDATVGYQVFGSSGVVAAIGVVDLTSRGTIQAEGTGAIGVRINRLFNDAADVYDTRIASSGTIAAAGDGAVGILIAHAARPASGPQAAADPTLADRGNSVIELSSTSVVRGGTGGGAAIRYVGGATHTLTNAGAIASAAGASGTTISGGTGAENVTNIGTITGAVRLGGGADSFTLDAAGSLAGAIDGGDGEDRFVLTGGAGTSATLNLATAPLSGFELLFKRGAGAWTIGGDGAGAGGAFAVEAGALFANADLRATTFSVRAGGRLGGAGRLGAVAVRGGILAPGQSIGTLTVAGLSLDAMSTLEIEVNDAGASDRVTVLGTVSLGGAALRILEGGAFAGTNPFSYIIIDNDGSDAVEGAFGAITNQLAFLTPTVSYTGGDGNDVLLTLRPNAPAPAPTPTPVPPGLFPTAALTPNQRAAATGLDRLDQATGTDSGTVYRDILFMTGPQARAAFDASSGEIYASLLAAEARDALAHVNGLSARGRAGGPAGWSLWGSAGARAGRTDGDGNAARVTGDGFTVDLGLEHRGGDWLVGAAAGYSEGDLSVAERLSQADLTGWHAGGYARWGSGGAGPTVSGAIAYARSDRGVRRAIRFVGIDRAAAADVTLSSWSGAAEARYGFALGRSWAAGPVLSLTAGDARLGRVAERGADSLDLSSGGGTDRQLEGGAGLFLRWSGARGRLDATFQYVAADDAPVPVTLALHGAPATPFTILSPARDAGMARLGLAGTIDLGGRWSLSGSGNAQIGGSQRDLSARLTIGWRF